MADAQSSSSAEVEGYVSQQHQQQQQQPVHFSPPPPPPDPTSAHGQGAVNDKSSRWSTRDDVQLCDALIAQKSMGRNTSAAVFTMDAWNAVADQMKGSEILSGGAVKTVAQCKARWQRLKIEYRIVKHLRHQPGFQWDENTQMVTALAATWDAYITEHKDSQPWRKKSFPCYSRVAFLIEDENGHDPGDEKFKRRWAAHASSAQQQPQSPQSNQGGVETSISTSGASSGAGAVVTPTVASSTSVFQVSALPSNQAASAPNVSFPGVAMTMPVNGGYTTIHQFRLPTQTNGKRAGTASGDSQSASSKRARSDANTNTSSTVVQPQPQPQQQPQSEVYTNAYPAQPGQPQPQPYPPGSVYYAAAPSTGPGPVPVPVSAPPSVIPPNIITTRLALAIQTVEDNESLSDADFVKAVQMFQRRMETAEAYLAIQSKNSRTMYLRAELDDPTRRAS